MIYSSSYTFLTISSRYDASSDKLTMSKAVFKKSNLNFLGKMIIRIGAFLKVLHIKENIGEDRDVMEINNMTLINLVIKFVGPIHEKNLTVILMALQVRSLFSVCFYFFQIVYQILVNLSALTVIPWCIYIKRFRFKLTLVENFLRFDYGQCCR